jgi:hypothetical protein
MIDPEESLPPTPLAVYPTQVQTSIPTFLSLPTPVPSDLSSLPISSSLAIERVAEDAIEKGTEDADAVHLREQTPISTKQAGSNLPKSLITGVHATIVEDSIPDRLLAGSRNLVTITLLNTGSTAWKQDEGIGISAVSGTASYAPSWQGVSAQSVEKGGAYIFEFTLLTPSIPGEYTLSFQAGKKRSELTSTFGRPYVKRVVVASHL